MFLTLLIFFKCIFIYKDFQGFAQNPGFASTLSKISTPSHILWLCSSLFLSLDKVSSSKQETFFYVSCTVFSITMKTPCALLMAVPAVPRIGPATEWPFTPKNLSKKLLKYLPLEYKLHKDTDLESVLHDKSQDLKQNVAHGGFPSYRRTWKSFMH